MQCLMFEVWSLEFDVWVWGLRCMILIEESNIKMITINALDL